MVKIKIIGGLGNQMFQYAAAKSLAVLNNTRVSANVSVFSNYKTHPLRLNKLNCDCEFDFTRDFRLVLSGFPLLGSAFSKKSMLLNHYVEKDLLFDSSFFDLDDNVLLSGYFQSEKYFSNIRELLIQEFSLDDRLTEAELAINNKIESCNSIAIHIRRGDYITDLSANNIHGICSEEYFEKALNYLDSINVLSDPTTTLFIFSDDILWCKDNLAFKYRTVFVEGSVDRPEVDIHLMSKCKHQVISNSTFSWWGAWLNTNLDKCVIAPLKWFNSLHDSTDIVPKQWMRL
ncbi:alpha-1,2-fucosyltransferase [Amphritea japonica]|uniref:Alpha-1,2-fucosyltransferase n=1 Tax=Amphritea japonica ATCC BAA-1530 TaxID=1278309 RepID=A0A7R6P9T7_9GAMM|nr:alpha-1,2-fucosyltransferase [Amphritea japonica]BBB25221.1 alpha-1,2-fucosyltransferase [Amphritea japonica ATCC BAA-1530]